MLYIILFLFGLVAGSFVNVVIYRLPRGRTFIKGRSRCPECNRVILWYDLIPLASFFALGFRCRRCKTRISWVYPAVEAYSGLIFALSFLNLEKFSLGAWLFSIVLLELLLILAVIDWKHLILPDSVMLAALIATLSYGIGQQITAWHGQPFILSFNNLTAAAVAFSAFFLFWFFSRGRWMGLGDAKLAGLIGLIFGGFGAILILYGAIVAGATVGLFLLATRRADLKTKLPLGTFIAFSASLYILLGPVVADRVKDIFKFVIPLFG